MRPRTGYVPIEPYREAIRQHMPWGQREEFRKRMGIPKMRWKGIANSRQKTIHVDDANLIAEGLCRVDLFVGEQELSTSRTGRVSDSRRSSASKNDLGASIKELLEREERAYKLLKLDNTIHPLDALAMVVWPPERFLEDAA